MADITTLTYKCPYLTEYKTGIPEAIINVNNGTIVALICANHECQEECKPRVIKVEHNLQKYTDTERGDYKALYEQIEAQVKKIGVKGNDLQQRVVTEMQKLRSHEELKTQSDRKCIIDVGFVPVKN